MVAETEQQQPATTRNCYKKVFGGGGRRAARRAEGKPHPSDNGGKWIKPAKRQAIYDRDGHRCIYCGGNGDDNKLTLDHLHPVELGGSNEARKLVTACLTCNSAKGKKPLKKFLLWLEEKGIDVAEVKARIKRHTARKLKGYNERMGK